MKKFVFLLFNAVVLPLFALEITPDKSDHSYKNGDKITFNIQLDKGRINTPFIVQLQGNRYIAPRVDVNVLAQDDTTAAVSGLSMGDYVITTSSKPLEAGMQVNMVEN